MSVDKNHNDQFEKYLKGQMTSKEAHAFERSVLNDPFSQEALEGLENENPNQVFTTMEGLRNEVSAKSKKSFSWIRIAAVIALLIVGSLTIWFTIDQVAPVEKGLAIKKDFNQKPEEIFPDSVARASEELIAEAEIIEDPEVKKFKKDGVKVVDEVELVEEKIESENVSDLTLESSQLADTEPIQIEEPSIEADIESAEILESTVAEVKIEEVAIVSDFQEIDTSELEDLVVAAPLIAQESNSNNLSKKTEVALQNSDQVTARSSSASLRSIQTNEATISGVVTDDIGEPLPGVNVVIKGTTYGTTTDLDGNYSLPQLEEITLVYSFVGFESQEIEAGDRSSIDVSMSGFSELQEVVVIAQGIRKEKRALGYAVSEVNTNKNAVPTTGFEAFEKYLKDNLIYPEAARVNEIKGTVVLELTISNTGDISNVDVKKSLGYGCDDEAVRLLDQGPKWEAAIKDGERIEDKVKVRVKFKP